MAASEKFTELKQQVETAESNVRAAAAQDQASCERRSIRRERTPMNALAG